MEGKSSVHLKPVLKGELNSMSESKRPATGSSSRAAKKRTKAKAVDTPEVEATDLEADENFEMPSHEESLTDDSTQSSPASQMPSGNGASGGRSTPAPAFRAEGGGESPRPGSEYTTQCYYDKSSRVFVAFVVEAPDVRVSGYQKQQVISELENKLEQHLQEVRRRGDTLPEAIYHRRYPDRLDVKISQGLYRKLDLLSKQERIPLDQLVGELLAASVERRLEGGRSQDRRHHQPAPQAPRPHQHNNQRPQHRDRNRQAHSHNNDPESRGNQRQPQHSGHSGHSQGGPRRRRNYHETMDNRDNFMEYVRNLEKGNWRKK